MSCEDFPCCGHEAGCCPDFGDDGQQLNMRCTCGAHLPVNSRLSICRTCLEFEDDEFYDEQDVIEAGYDDDFDDSLDDHDDCFDDGFEIDDDSFCYDHGFYGDEC